MIRVMVTSSPCETYPDGQDVWIEGMSKGTKVQFFADSRSLHLYLQGISETLLYLDIKYEFVPNILKENKCY